DAPEVVPGSEIPDQADVDGNTITPIDASTAFTDADSTDVLTFSVAGLPTGLTIDANTGVISGTVDNSASQNAPGGVFTVTVTATDSAGATVTDTFTYTITNPAPVAQDNDYTAGADDPAAVIGNAVVDDTGDGVDSDPDGDALQAVVQSNTPGDNGGLFSIAANGDVTFDPNGEFSALAPGETMTTSVTYTVNDGEGGSDTATITVTVTGVNDDPTATDNDYTVGEDDAPANLGNVLTDDTGDGVDSDPDGGTLTVLPQTDAPGSNGGLFTIGTD
ncbi:Ig-like domain-containing protein, partial [Hydrogenophaga sp. 5NK40-0174]|uniref:Ig-like domain-containing protein n=1 Tax=Hydrogenophaga sp. 5NK40-0174 TaxID=3127649 RepID=UPI00333E525E